MLDEGTKTRTSKQIAEQVDSLGATLSASAGFGSGSATLAASGLSDTFEQWFALTTDVLLHPSFPADELAQYQAATKPALLQQRSQPNFLANQTFNRVLYGTYPAAVVSATPESLDSLTPRSSRTGTTSTTRRRIPILAISGDVHAATLIPKLRQWLAEWQRSKTVVTFPPGPPPATKNQGVSGGPSRIGADHAADGQPGDRARRSGLSRARRVERSAGRGIGEPPVPEFARRKRLHVWRVQQCDRSKIRRSVDGWRRLAHGSHRRSDDGISARAKPHSR